MFPPPRVSVGTMNFGARTPAAEARRIIDRAIDQGLSFFDTANVYGNGESERILGAAVRGRRQQVGLATKVGLLRLGGKPEGLGAERITGALDESLERLGTDYVDLYYLHAPDPSTPLEQTLDAIHGLLDSGRIRAWGLSNHAAWQILEIQIACDARKMPRPAVSQVLYNLLVRQLDLEYFAFAARHPIHTTVYNPLAGGLLARGAEGARSHPPGSRLATNKLYAQRYGSERMQAVTQAYRELASAEGLDLLTLAYAWLAGKPGVDSVLTGPATLAHFEAAVAGCAHTLSVEARTRIDETHRAMLGTDVSYAR